MVAQSTVDPMSHYLTPPVADDDLATCVACGLCLPHCPTYRATGEETRSPRGRIAVIKNVQDEGGIYDQESAEMLNSCIQCRGCEPACPSGVPYGRIIGQARQALLEQGLSTSNRSASLALRFGLKALTWPRFLSAGGRIISGANKFHLVPRRWSLGPLPIRLGRRLSSATADPEVWIFTGCVMDVWMRQTHLNTATLVMASGQSFGVPQIRGACCGALHQHAGLVDDARHLAEAVMRSMPGEQPIVVNSAGCGAALKEYGELLGTPEAHHFAERVKDIHEWLEPLMPEIISRVGGAEIINSKGTRVVLQDPCHLRHVQKSHIAVKRVLENVVGVITIDDDGLCCGAGGSYSFMEPTLAHQVRQQKVEAIRRATDDEQNLVVASANPGCAMFLAQAGLTVRHPVDIVAELLGLVAPTDRSSSFSVEPEMAREVNDV
jgi:glycolate oxidase iron-sulfur subunit